MSTPSTLSQADRTQANSTRVAYITLAASVAAGLFYIFLAMRQGGAWQLFTLAGCMLVFLIADGLSIFFIQRGQTKTGVWLIFIASLIIVPLHAALLSKVAVLMAISGVLLSTIIITQGLSTARQRWIAGLLGLVSVAVTASLDFVELKYRLFVPEIGTFIPALTAIALVIVGSFVLYQLLGDSLRSRLLAAFTFITIVPLSIALLINNLLTTDIVSQSAHGVLQNVAGRTAEVTEKYILERLNDVFVESQKQVLREYLLLPADQRAGSETETELYNDLRSIINHDKEFITSVGLLDEDGISVADTEPTEIGINKSTRSYFLAVQNKKEPFFSPVEISATTSELSNYLSAPILDTENKFIGVLRIRYSAKALQDIVEESADESGMEGITVAIFDEYHIRLADSDSPELVFKSVVPLPANTVERLKRERRLNPNQPTEQLSTNIPALEAGLNNIDNDQFFTAEFHTATEGVLEEGAAVRIENRQWIVTAAQTRDAFLLPLEQQNRTNVWIGLVIVIFVVLASAIVAELVSRPLARLTVIAQKISNGDTNLQAIGFNSEDEIGKLANAFNLMTQRLRDLISSLEERIAERTAKLERRNLDLALATEIGQTVSQVRSINEMLQDAAEIIRAFFGLYYVQVYLLADNQQELVLKFGTGTMGEDLMRAGHRIPIDASSINGQAALNKRSIVVPDTSNSDLYQAESLLPNTRSEIAVPLLIGGNLIGVLNAHGEHPNQLNEDALLAFEPMAGQIAVAIQNTRLVEDAQRARAETEALARRLTQIGWEEYLDAIHKPELVGYSYELGNVQPITQVENAIEKGEHVVTVPITISGEKFGELVIDLASGNNPDEILDLSKTVMRQVAQQIENLRLLENAERYRQEAEETIRRETHTDWAEFVARKNRQKISYMYNLREVRPAYDVEAPENALQLPLKIRDESIGQVSIEGIDANDQEAIQLANIITDRLSNHIENLRLSEQTQERARREQALRQITSAVRGSTNPETILRTAVRELGVMMGRKVSIHMSTEGQPKPEAPAPTADDEPSANHDETPNP